MGTEASAEIDPSLYMTRPPKKIEKRNAVLATLTPSNIADGVKLEDDGMEAFAKMSALNAFAVNAGWADRVEADNLFRAFIDRKTGKVTYQLYQTITYTDEFRIYDAANVLMPSGLVTKDLRKLGSEIIYCGAGLTCRREETIAIDLDDDEMQAIADVAKIDPMATVRIRFKSHTSMDWNDDLLSVEAQGLLLAVDRWRAKRG
jgi:hypothetical protein